MRQKLARVLGGVAIAGARRRWRRPARPTVVATAAAARPPAAARSRFFGALTGDAAGLGIHDAQRREAGRRAVQQGRTPTARSSWSSSTRRATRPRRPRWRSRPSATARSSASSARRFSGESEAANPIFDEAGLAIITPSATRPSLSTEGLEDLPPGVGNDPRQGPAAGQLHQERAEGREGLRHRRPVRVRRRPRRRGQEGPRRRRRRHGQGPGRGKQTDFSATVTKIKSRGANVVFYGGYYPEAGLLLQAAARAPAVTAHVRRRRRRQRPGVHQRPPAQAAAEGTILTCPCAPATEARGTFVRRLQGGATAPTPGTYSDDGLRRGEHLAGRHQGRQDHPRGAARRS